METVGEGLTHVVSFSGGLSSWIAARRVVEEHGRTAVVLLFADTLMEDEDLYRFLPLAAANVGVPVTRVVDGRTPWEVFFDERFLGNSLIDPCSKHLKRRLMRKWLEANCDPAKTVVYIGFDWTEVHRTETGATYWTPWQVEAPLQSGEVLSKAAMMALCRSQGIEPPRLYLMGFEHNNCGGFCIKAGQAHFRRLLRELPDRYRYHEEQEQRLRAHLNKDVAILTDRRNRQKVPLTLRDFRLRLHADPANFDQFDFGGCGCMTGSDE